MALLKVGPLPKVNSGGHNRPGGVFAGHADDAVELKRLAKRDEAEQWGCVREGIKAPTASRTAMVIRKGLAVDFQPDDEGYYVAKSRQGTGYRKGRNEVFEVWVKFKFWDSEEEKRRVLSAMDKAKAKQAQRVEAKTESRKNATPKSTTPTPRAKRAPKRVLASV